MPQYEGASELTATRYEHNGEHVDLGVAWYSNQAQGRELVFYANRLVDPEDWRKIGRSSVVRQPDRLFALEQFQNRRGERRLIAFWYEVGGQVVLSDWGAKASQLPAFIRGRRDGALVAVSSDCEGGCEVAERTISEFVQALGQPAIRLHDPASEAIL
jgi:EpsI family protein